MRSEPREPRPARVPRVPLSEPQYHCSVELVTKRTISNQDRAKCVVFRNMHRLFGIWLVGSLAMQASDLAHGGARLSGARCLADQTRNCPDSRWTDRIVPGW